MYASPIKYLYLAFSALGALITTERIVKYNRNKQKYNSFINFNIHSMISTGKRILGILFRTHKPILILLGFLITIYALELMYGDFGISVLIKGISIQNTINLIINFNIAELIIWGYFILCFIFLLILDLLIDFSKNNLKYSDSTNSVLHGFVKSIREGVLIIPAIIMVVFPFLVQTFLPFIIYGILLLEMLVPFALFSKLFSIFISNLALLVHHLKNRFSSTSILDVATNLFKIVVSYPIPIYLLMIVNLDIFFNFAYFHFFWENPSSEIALVIWGWVNWFFEFFFQITDLDTKRFFVIFTVLAFFSVLFSYGYKKFKYYSELVIDQYLLPYKA